MRYSSRAPLVLHGITCKFHAGSRIGIVGRTGCGKSTLIQALFRIVEPAGGEILIDGLNVCTVGLHDLRSRLSIIPQDPVLFEGTVRGNLDPLESFSDVDIWEVRKTIALLCVLKVGTSLGSKFRATLVANRRKPTGFSVSTDLFQDRSNLRKHVWACAGSRQVPAWWGCACQRWNARCSRYCSRILSSETPLFHAQVFAEVRNLLLTLCSDREWGKLECWTTAASLSWPDIIEANSHFGVR